MNTNVENTVRETEGTIEIKTSAIDRTPSTAVLYGDIESIKGIDATKNEVTGKTIHGFNFRKVLNSIVVF